MTALDQVDLGQNMTCDFCDSELCDECGNCHECDGSCGEAEADYICHSCRREQCSWCGGCHNKGCEEMAATWGKRCDGWYPEEMEVPDGL